MPVRLIAARDRRSPNRLPTPVCKCCGTAESVVAIIRTTRFVYFRCQQCRELLPKRVPPVALRYGLIACVSDDAGRADA
jgi:hypothetical protein